MKTTRCAPLTVTWPSEQLRGAALAGLLCFATAACSSNDDAPGANGSAGATTSAGTTSSAGTAGKQSAAGAEAGGAGGTANAAAGAHADGGAEAAGSGGEAAGGTSTTVGGAAGAGGAVDGGGVGGAGGAGSVVEPAHITSSTNVGVLTEEQFTALCDERDGTVEVMPHCGGFATAAGFSYDSGTQLLSEHTCAGANTCGGWNCITTK